MYIVHLAKYVGDRPELQGKDLIVRPSRPGESQGMIYGQALHSPGSAYGYGWHAFPPRDLDVIPGSEQEIPE